jgi:hypothetical protein
MPRRFPHGSVIFRRFALLEPTVHTVVFQLHVNVNQFWCVCVTKTRLRVLDFAGIDLMYSWPLPNERYVLKKEKKRKEKRL